jgi:citrate lyase subunit beta/citryl-CoA lyase
MNHAALQRARSLLFVPGNRPERFAKALASGADAVIIDLEDSVPMAAKYSARQAIGDAWQGLRSTAVPLVIRINALAVPEGRDDVEWLVGLDPADGVMIPKAESFDAIEALNARLPGVALLPIIESAAGYAALPDIARAAGVLRLAVGHIDFMADTGLQCSAHEPELAPLRFAVAMATRLAQLAPAIDGVTVDLDDEARLRDDTGRALRFGFGGKLCIHPRQVAVVHDAMTPSALELDRARRIIAAAAGSGGAAVQLDGRMVDLPVVLQAQRTLSRARGERPDGQAPLPGPEHS